MGLSLSGLLAHLLPLSCVVAASFLQSLTGFGLAIVLAPLLMFFYDAKEVVSLVLLICVTGNLVQGAMHFREADRRLVAFLFAGVVLGQPIGAWIFFALSSDTLKFCINAMFASGEIRQIASVEKRQFGSAEIRQFESIEKSQS